MQGFGRYRHVAFGLSWDSTIHLTQFAEAADSNAAPDIHVRLCAGTPPKREALASWGRSEIFVDGFRFHADDFAVFDFYNTEDRLDTFPGPKWVGEMPSFFYGVVAAAILALRGAIPIHGSAVALDGRAVLICGRSGLGKSSITSHLIKQGGKLISDDLSVLSFDEQRVATLSAGRTNIRLGTPAVAAISTPDVFSKKVGVNLLGKSLMEMSMVSSADKFVLTSIVFLGSELDDSATELPPFDNSKKLIANLFRPGLMRKLPAQLERVKTLMTLTANIRFLNVLSTPPLDSQKVEMMAAQIYEFHRHGKQ